MTLRGRVRTALFDLDPDAVRLQVRGFVPTTDDKHERLESSGTAFVRGYRAAIRFGDAADTSAACEEVALPLRGFAYEGGAVGLTVLDLVTGGRPRRFRRFLLDYADRHAYMVHVGAGWAIARCPWGVGTFLPRLDPVFSCLAIDGMGFHAGFFHPAAVFDRQRLPLLRRWGPDLFDAGLGRSLWFVSGAQPDYAVRSIETFARARRPSLWSGLGLAVTYAAGASEEDLQWLARAAGPCLPCVAQGAAFAAKARQRAGNPTPETEQACRVFCGLSAADAAVLTDRCLERVASGPGMFQRWRELLVTAFTTA